MAYCLRECVVLVRGLKDLNLVPNTHTKNLTTVCNSSFMGFSTLSSATQSVM